MNYFSEILNKKILIIISIIILMGIGIAIYFINNPNETIDTEILSEIEENIYGNDIKEIEEIEEIEENNGVDANNIKREEQTNEEKIAVHITGEVKNAGIVYLEKGNRIIDAIEKAGGATKDAGLDQVNLAYVLEDGQKIYIPNKNEKSEKDEYIISDSGKNVLVEEGRNTDNTNTVTKGANYKVNINSANQSELETLPGIGPSLAQRIIEYRETNGKFQKIEDIQNVKGIGNSKYSNIKDYIII